MIANVKTEENFRLTAELMAELSNKEDTSELMAIIEMREDKLENVPISEKPFVIMQRYNRARVIKIALGKR